MTTRKSLKRNFSEASQPRVSFDTREVLLHAVDSFIRNNCNFESSVPVNTAIEEIMKCTTLQSVFAIPLQLQLFSMDAALRWVLFLSNAPERSVADGDTPFVDDKFSAKAALTLITNVYDIGIQEAVWASFEEDEESEAEETEEEETVPSEN